MLVTVIISSTSSSMACNVAGPHLIILDAGTPFVFLATPQALLLLLLVVGSHPRATSGGGEVVMGGLF